MSKTVGLLVLLTAYAHAQVTVTFSPQGQAALQALTGKRIHGFQIVSVLACSQATAVSVSGGALYELAAQGGYQWIDPGAAAVIINRTVQFNVFNVTANALVDGSSFASLLVAGGVIKAGATILTALIAGHGFLDQVQGRLNAYAPDPTPVLSKLLQADTVISLQPLQCVDRYLGAQYDKKYRPATLHLDAALTSEVVNMEVQQKIVRAHLEGLRAWEESQ